MLKENLHLNIDRLARYKYLKNRIDPDGYYPAELMDVTPQEIEDLYKQAEDEIVRNLVDVHGNKPYYTAAEFRSILEYRYQKELETRGLPDNHVIRFQLYDKIEREMLEGKAVDVGPSGVIPSGITLIETGNGLAPFGIAPSGTWPNY